MFKPVDPKVDFPKMERQILDWWFKTGIVKKYLKKNTASNKRFSFLDGPITANNPMGIHHAWGRTYKDLWQRYFNMKGYGERFQNGFDCQGLWVEVEVEKELGFKSKKDIEKYGIARFVEKCKERVCQFSKIQTEQSKRLGYFMDWDNSYYTMSDQNNYMIWYFLKKCHEKGLIYKGRDSVPWCPRCGTAISQHEILTEDYKEIAHETIFFKLPVLNRDFSLLAWTTTPWTIPANTALAINPKFVYKEWKNLKTDEKMVVLREDQIEEEEDYNRFIKNIFSGGNWQGVRDYEGKDLVGLKYKGPFDDLPRVKKALGENSRTSHTVVAAEDLVVATKGTGILHTAPGAGEEDFKLAKEKSLPVIEVIDEEGSYYQGMGEFSGKNAKIHPEIIIDYLKKKDNGKFLFKTVPISHRYPVCWRCKTELVWRVVEEWYIAMDLLREPMKKVTQEINWIPAFGLERELDWLTNMRDWLISKKRYWGLALPIWECQKCGEFVVIGSKEELKEKAVEGWEDFSGHSPHRPWIDKVKIKCKCGEAVSRIPDVGNPWLDAGIVPFSTMPKSWFPADFITESFPGQFKNWFYSLLAMSTVLKNESPFKTVLGFATLLAEDGRPMHKSLGNAIEFNEGADKIGVDVMRWMYVTQNPADNLVFGYHKADEVRRRFHLMLWNIYNFFITYSLVDKWKPSTIHHPSSTIHVLDRWIISKLHGLIRTVTESLDKYDAQAASSAIEKFVEDLSLWYVRRSRDRVGPTAEDGEDKNACDATLYEILVTLSKLLAPFTPFLAEEIFRNLTGEESVHLTDWPEANISYINISHNERMEQVRKICEIGHAARKQEGIKVRQPLKKFSIFTSRKRTCSKQAFQFSIEDEFLQLIKDELNVKEVVVKAGKGELKVALDTKITPELKTEGEARELVRQIQALRKEKGCKLDEKIIIYAPLWPKEFEEDIKKQTLAKQLLWAKSLKISTG